ncbi:MAG: cupin domain-containing protein [Sphingobium sp.]|nr:cupin domain-containing protein [Sphingobium sp.]
MPKIDLDALTADNKTGYPPPHNEQVQGRWKKRLGPVTGMGLLGATHCVLKPGAWSSHRHWHDTEDEFLVMLDGEAMLIEDGGETILRSGDMAAWPAGVRNGHHVVNRSDADCSFVCFSAGTVTSGGYSDIDMIFTDKGFFRKDGSPF